MNKIKHIKNNEVHILKNNSYTECGCNIKENKTHWIEVSPNTKVTCAKKGCKKK